MNTIPCPQDFKSFYRSLSVEQREAFALAANTTTVYIETHLVYARKIPRRASMDALWQACTEFGAVFSREDLLAFFFTSHQEPKESPASPVPPPPAKKSGKPKAAAHLDHPEAAY